MQTVHTDSTINTVMIKFTGTKPISKQIADYYEKLIRLDVYPEGSYLPSIREVALEFKVNPNTVYAGYSLLCKKGTISAIPKKGYQVNAKPKKEINKDLHDKLKALLEEGYSIDEMRDMLLYLERRNKK